MLKLFDNPELVRHWRAQLRPRKMLAITVITWTLIAVITYAAHDPQDPNWSRHLASVILGAQFAALAVWGGLSCIQSIHRERDFNSLDFQRITRLTSDELIFGKLLGIPAVPLFIFAILLPPLLALAVHAKLHPASVLASLLVLLLGSIAFCAWALVLSLFQRGNSAISALGFLFALLMAGLSGEMFRVGWALAEVSPTFAFRLLEEKSWTLAELQPRWESLSHVAVPLYDLFFGYPIHHFYVLIILLATLTAWAWVVLRRNLKRDQSAQRLFTPFQSLLFCAYVVFIMVAFYRWRGQDYSEHQSVLLLGILLPVALLTLGLLRNRESLRVDLRMKDVSRVDSWLEATWPAAFALVGMLPMGSVVLILSAHHAALTGGAADWSWGIFKLAMLLLWLMRDVAYLQWSALRLGRHPLIMGMLYLLVFYTASLILVGAIYPAYYASLPVSSAIFGVSSLGAQSVDSPWTMIWLFPLLLHLVLFGVFTWLQQRKIREISQGLAAARTPQPAGVRLPAA